MKNQDLEFFKKGTFKTIDLNFIKDGKEVLLTLKTLQEKYAKLDTDSVMNELRDEIVGFCLGYNEVNVEKHGFDCKRVVNGQEEFLEVKVASTSSKTWSATFNDTTFEKAEAFKDKKTFVALAIWDNAADISFIVYGQNDKIGDYLEQKVKDAKIHSRRSTQTISCKKLIEDFDFQIINVEPKEKVIERLNNARIKFSEDKIIDIEEFNPRISKDIIPMITQNKSIYEIIGEKERGIPFQVKNLSEALKTANTDELETLIDNFEDLKLQAEERLQTLRDNNQNNEYRKTYGEKIAEEYQKYKGLLKAEVQQNKENRGREC